MRQQEERVMIVTDGAYIGTENTQEAAVKKIKLITTSPVCKLSVSKLMQAEYLNRFTKIAKSKSAHEWATIQRNMSNKELKDYIILRNGIETVPSNIARITILKRCHVGNSMASSFSVAK